MGCFKANVGMCKALCGMVRGRTEGRERLRWIGEEQVWENGAEGG